METMTLFDSLVSFISDGMSGPWEKASFDAISL